MTKAFLQPKKNDFMLLLSPIETLHPHRPSVVTVDSYVQSIIAAGKIKVLKEDLPDHANDKAFERVWEDSNRDDSLAMSNYESILAKGPDAQGDAEEEEKPDMAKKNVNKGTSTTSAAPVQGNTSTQKKE